VIGPWLHEPFVRRNRPRTLDKEREAKITGGRKWPVLPSRAPQLLRVLGLLNADASMSADSVRKFSQINHMVSLLEPHLEDIAQRHPVVRILDVGCGTSYLTLLLAWLLKEQGHEFQVIGVDSNSKVVATSAARAKELGLDVGLRFEAAEIDVNFASNCFERIFPGEGSKNARPHLLVALHACDVASDLAIAAGIRAKADVMAVAPCCHAELARQWKGMAAATSHPFGPIFRSPNLRRDVAANMTDALRMLLARSRGYEVTATEFVPSTHTAEKSTAALRSPRQLSKSRGAPIG